MRKMGCLRVAEFVLPGHADKVADAIADRIVAAALASDPLVIAGIEVAVHRDLTVVTGCVIGAGANRLDLADLVAQVHADVGAPERASGPGRCQVDAEVRDLTPREVAARGHVSGDQAIVCGWATSIPGTDGLPVEHAVARRVAIALWRLRLARPDLALGPDGKVIVSIREAESLEAWTLDDVTVSIQHHAGWDAVVSRRAIAEAVGTALDAAARTIPGLSVPAAARVPRTNPGGEFATGGTHGDNGLSGKKLVVDFYGPRVPIGGGALSGKDFTAVDRAGALIARDLALEVTSRGGRRTCEVALSIRPGDEAFRVARLVTDGGDAIDLDEAATLVDLGIGSRLDWPFRHGPLTEVARWGHFAPLPSFG